MNGVTTNGTATYTTGPKEKALKRYIATWDFSPCRNDEMELNKGDVLLVADEFEDGWMRGLKMGDLEIGFFPASFVAVDPAPIYKLRELNSTSTTDLYSSETKLIENDCSKRSKIAFEIFTSEEVYLKKLRMLNERFVVPLRDNAAVISHEDYHPVFSNIQPLLSLAESLIVQLKSRMEGWDDRSSRIGDIFMHMGHHMKLFMTYAVQHTLGSQILIKIAGQEKFRSWLGKTEVDCKRTLNSLLLEPIQRVPRYEMLLKDLFKHTSEDHPDYTTLKEALNFMQKIASDCNENIRRAENELKLFAITKRFPHDEVEVVPARWITKNAGRVKGEGGTLKKKKRVSENSLTISKVDSNSTMSVRSFFESEHRRVFVREGVVSKTKHDFTDPAERYLILCSDVLLIAQSSSRARKSFKLKERVMLVHAWVTDTGSLMAQQKVPERGFILGTPLKVYHFLAPTLEEKSLWFQEIQSRIFTQKRLFNELLSHLSVPDENFESMKVKAKVGYMGMLKDELSFKAGDEISVVGFKTSAGKWKPGLYSQEPFDPSPEWYFGTLKENYGWFPMQCVMGTESKVLEPLDEELEPTPMCIVLNLKQRMIELTGRVIPPLTETERTAKVYTGEGNFKTLRVPLSCTVDDIVRMYFKVKPDCQLAWSLIEQSADGTVLRPLDPTEEPSEVVDFWGKTRDRMRFILKQSVISLEVDEIGDTDA